MIISQISLQSPANRPSNKY